MNKNMSAILIFLNIGDIINSYHFFILSTIILELPSKQEIPRTCAGDFLLDCGL